MAGKSRGFILRGPKADTFLLTFDSFCKETPPIDWAISHFTCSSRKQCKFSDCQIRKAILPTLVGGRQCPQHIQPRGLECL